MVVTLPLVAEQECPRLAVSDQSAAVLTEVLLSPATVNVECALKQDAWLALWTVCRADELEGLAVTTARQGAQWLRQHALRALSDTANSAAPVVDLPAQPDLAKARNNGIELAQTTACLVPSEEEILREQATFLALLYAAAPQPNSIDSSRNGNHTSCLPNWLTVALAEIEKPPVDRTVPAFWVANARTSQRCRRNLKSDPDSNGAEGSSEASIETKQASESRPGSGAGHLLDRLVDKLARLDQLETRFAETLEAEKLESMAEFAAGAGHEINNPLAIISGRTQLFLRDETDAERRRELALLNSQALRVYEMIADMMLYARPPRPEVASVDVGQLLDEIVTTIEPKAAARRVQLITRLPQSPLCIRADPTQLSVAIKSLCDNSMFAIGEQGQLKLTARAAAGGTVEIEVHDSGPGIPDDVRRHLFDPFYSGRGAGRGLGLGLSKCWRIVTNHGGRVDVVSQPGQGTTFTLVLPVEGPTAEKKTA